MLCSSSLGVCRRISGPEWTQIASAIRQGIPFGSNQSINHLLIQSQISKILLQKLHIVHETIGKPKKSKVPLAFHTHTQICLLNNISYYCCFLDVLLPNVTLCLNTGFHWSYWATETVVAFAQKPDSVGVQLLAGIEGTRQRQHIWTEELRPQGQSAL